jgi:rod shape-determining protein MreC
LRPRLRYRTPLIVVLAVFLVISVLSLSLKRSPVLTGVEGWVVSVAAPGLQSLEYLGRGVKNLWQGYFYLVGVRQENLRLRRSLEEYRQKEVNFLEAQRALTRLETLLDLKRQVALPVIGARVIAYDPSLWSRCAVIDQGKAQGVKNGLPVLAPQGIVGRVVETYPQYAKVMLIVDRKSGAEAVVQRTRVRGIIQGKGGNRCSLDYVPKSADVQVGDLVLASGLGGIYPKGLVFGKVTEANKKSPGVFQKIEVTPIADLSALEEVLVVKVASVILSQP